MSNSLIMLPVMFFVTFLGAFLYVIASYWAETFLKNPRKPTTNLTNFILGFLAIEASVTIVLLSLLPSTHDFSGGTILLGIACLVLGDRFIYYPDNPPVPVTPEKNSEDVR